MKSCTSIVFGSLLVFSPGLVLGQTTYTWDGTTDTNWTNGPQDNSLGGVFPANGTTGSNWTVGGVPTQLAVPDANTPGTNLVNYQFTAGDTWIIPSGSIINEDVQIRLSGGSLSIDNSTVSLLPTSATTTGGLSALNLGETAGGAVTATITDSTLNVGRANAAGRAIGVLNGSGLTVTNSIINVTSEAGSGDFDVEESSSVLLTSGSTVNVEAGVEMLNTCSMTVNNSTIDAGWIRVNSTTSFDFQSGTITLDNVNPFRANSFNGSFNWTGAAGSGTITHSNLGTNFSQNPPLLK